MAHVPIRSLFPAPLLAIVLCLGRVTAQAAAYKRDLMQVLDLAEALVRALADAPARK